MTQNPHPRHLSVPSRKGAWHYALNSVDSTKWLRRPLSVRRWELFTRYGGLVRCRRVQGDVVSKTFAVWHCFILRSGLPLHVVGGDCWLGDRGVRRLLQDVYPGGVRLRGFVCGGWWGDHLPCCFLLLLLLVFFLCLLFGFLLFLLLRLFRLLFLTLLLQLLQGCFLGLPSCLLFGLLLNPLLLLLFWRRMYNYTCVSGNSS